jgi:hypothetical protein
MWRASRRWSRASGSSCVAASDILVVAPAFYADLAFASLACFGAGGALPQAACAPARWEPESLAPPRKSFALPLAPFLGFRSGAQPATHPATRLAWHDLRRPGAPSAGPGAACWPLRLRHGRSVRAEAANGKLIRAHQTRRLLAAWPPLAFFLMFKPPHRSHGKILQNFFGKVTCGARSAYPPAPLESGEGGRPAASLLGRSVLERGNFPALKKGDFGGSGSPPDADAR